MAKTKKIKKKRKNKTVKKKLANMNLLYALNFEEIPVNTPTKLWTTDYFGYRKSIPVNQYKIIQSIDNMNLASDYKKNKTLYKFAGDEYRKRLRLEIQNNKKSKKFIERKIKKKITPRNIEKRIEKIPLHKVEKLYFSLLERSRE